MNADERGSERQGTKLAPRSACVFACAADAVQFEKNDEAGTFHIQVYDGSVTNHWYWGNFAIDLTGLTFAGKRLPVLDSHFTDRRVGVSTDQKIADKVTVEGRFLKNAAAQALRADMMEDFPMQASLAARPGIVEQVADGATAHVNGHRLKGPGAIWRQAAIYEVSMCAFGALPNTKSTAMADDDNEQVEFQLLGDTEMAKDEKPALTIESFKAEHGELYTAVFAEGRTEGVKAEQDRFAALQKACGDDHALAGECFAAGMTVADALAKRNEKLTTELTAAKARLLESQNAGHEKPSADAATQEFITSPPPGKADEGPKTFMEAVERYQKEHQCKRSVAVGICVDLYPELHKKMTGGE